MLANAVVQTALALAAALILREKFPGVRFARIWIVLSWIVPTVVVVIIWRWLFSSSGGMVNPILMMLGVIDRPVGFFSSHESAMATLVFINSWRWFPFVALMIFAALTRIPRDLTRPPPSTAPMHWTRFRFITWPLLQPTLSVLFVVGTLLSFNVFDIIWLITAGGPSQGTQTLPVLIYETAFKGLSPQRGGGDLGDHEPDPDGLRHHVQQGNGPRRSDPVKRSPVATLALALGLAAFALLIGLPFWWVITGSIKLPQESSRARRR